MVYESIFPACPDGFEYYNGRSCILVKNSPKTKSEADSFCYDANYESDVFVAKTLEEERELLKIMKREGIEETFLGMHKDGNGNFLWDNNKRRVFNHCKNTILLCLY